MPRLSALRLTFALFFTAFGYALLSVCLFRVMALSLSSTAFFMLYVCAGMPLGALLARRFVRDWRRGAAVAAALLPVVGALLPLLGWIIAQGPSPLLENLQYTITFGGLWKQLIWLTLASSPLFVSWGAAEYIGYEAALDHPAIRKGFYLIFVWGLACALAAGDLVIPRTGWLRTVILAALAGQAALEALKGGRAFRAARLAPWAALALLWMGAGAVEPWWTRIVLPSGMHQAGSALKGRHPLTNAPLPPGTSARLLHAGWGRCAHVSLVEFRDKDGVEVMGCYDGAFIWTCRPDGRHAPSLDDMALDAAGQGADICIVGSGGGRQVGLALERGPRSVEALDIVPGIFPLLTGEFAWINKGVYNAPEVNVHAMDGRKYLENAEKKFDLIMLPHTESIAAAMKSAIEPGRWLHTVEAFRTMKDKLKPGGVLAVIKLVDRKNRLFFTYANTLREAGFEVRGWTTAGENNPFGVHGFILMASLPGDAQPGIAPPRGLPPESPLARAVHYTEFPETAVLHDDSPWSQGLTGLFFEPNALKKGLASIFVLAAAGLALILACMRNAAQGRAGAALLFVLAGAAVGVNAICLENALIFWLMTRLPNPLTAFFAGAALFLLLWGLSGLWTDKWPWMACAALAGAAGLGLMGDWRSAAGLACLLLMILGAGLFFPLLGVRFRSGLLALFAADAVGGLAGSLTGVWIPMLSGFGSYFKALPWVCAAALALCAACLKYGPAPFRRERPQRRNGG